ncbi:MAG: molybdopterin converting factor subunit 1, partial [Anaerolineales bacterium]
MIVRVLYFATLRDRAGVRQEEISLPESATVAELKQTLASRHSDIGPALGAALVSVNREYAMPEERLNEGDEVAVFPPVSGGAGPTLIRITQDPLDLNELLAQVVLPTTGAACVFSGVVRGQTQGESPKETDHLEYEAYPAMAEEKMRQVADEIRARWPTVEGIALVQRVGRLMPGTPTVLIACSAGHRDSGVFEAARYGIDRLKEIVPVWKKEVGPEGEAWVEGHFRPTRKDR